jgi:hypothetical protein
MGSMYNTQLCGNPVKSVEPLHTKDKTGVYNTDQLPLPSTPQNTVYSTLLAGNFGTQETSQDPETTYPLRNQAKLHSFAPNRIHG